MPGPAFALRSENSTEAGAEEKLRVALEEKDPAAQQLLQELEQAFARRVPAAAPEPAGRPRGISLGGRRRPATLPPLPQIDKRLIYRRLSQWDVNKLRILPLVLVGMPAAKIARGMRTPGPSGVTEPSVRRFRRNIFRGLNRWILEGKLDRFGTFDQMTSHLTRLAALSRRHIRSGLEEDADRGTSFAEWILHERILPRLMDPAPQIRLAALRALKGKQPEPNSGAAYEVTDRVQTLLVMDPEEEIRAAAVYALIDLAPFIRTPAYLRKAISDPDNYVSVNAQSLLAGLGSSNTDAAGAGLEEGTATAVRAPSRAVPLVQDIGGVQVGEFFIPWSGLLMEGYTTAEDGELAPLELVNVLEPGRVRILAPEAPIQAHIAVHIQRGVPIREEVVRTLQNDGVKISFFEELGQIPEAIPDSQNIYLLKVAPGQEREWVMDSSALIVNFTTADPELGIRSPGQLAALINVARRADGRVLRIGGIYRSQRDIFALDIGA